MKQRRLAKLAACGFAAALLLLVCRQTLARSPLDTSAALKVQPGRSALPPALNATAAPPLPLHADGTTPLRLCECERATGAPNGLSCDKEGWFISSFERQGQWVAGGGYVPLSHAICCRPCLPSELPPDPSGRIPGGESPLAVISLGCHASTDRVLPTRCEEKAGSFVSGYSEAIKVFSSPDTYYPINTVQCCTPALLLENGDAWELERCQCRDSADPDFPVNCGGTTTDELLLGYIFFRLSPLGHVVPVGPAQCCKACLSGTVHPMNQCDDLNQCSGHGVCNLRRCECFDGWTGADCSQARGCAAQNGKSVPPWAIALIVLSSSALAGVFIIAAGYALQALGMGPSSPAASEDGGDERQPLLIRIDADDAGSVGSADTTDAEDEVDVDEVERRVNMTIERLEGAASRGEPAPAAAAADQAAEAAAQESGEAAAAGQAAERSDAAAEAEPGAAGAVGAAAQPAAGDTETQGGAAVTPAGAAHAEAAGPAAEDSAADEPIKPPHGSCGGAPEGPLAMVDCSVCMSRPVQVVVVPCGHCCMCRRCSRRLNRCPMCRKEIARRQRLYV
ncbi:hypothetical protein ABPG75_009889 [Micractinium tetrahymenae]